MKYIVDKQDNYTTIKLQEENLNSVIAPDLKSEFIFFNNEGVKNLFLDFSEVKYVDSSGLSSILTANRLWKDKGHFIIFGIQHSAVQRIIEISRLNTILNIVPDIATAIEQSQNSEEE